MKIKDIIIEDWIDIGVGWVRRTNCQYPYTVIFIFADKDKDKKHNKPFFGNLKYLNDLYTPSSPDLTLQELKNYIDQFLLSIANLELFL